jgi:hypothetical protein
MCFEKLFYRVLFFYTRQSSFFAECFFALGKEGLCRVFFFTRQSSFFAECFLFSTQQRASLPIARKKTLGKPRGIRQRTGFL